MHMRNKLTLTVTDDLRDLLEERARAEGRPLANYARWLLERGAREALVRANAVRMAGEPHSATAA
jgi:hypothetical protein